MTREQRKEIKARLTELFAGYDAVVGRPQGLSLARDPFDVHVSLGFGPASNGPGWTSIPDRRSTALILGIFADESGLYRRYWSRSLSDDDVRESLVLSLRLVEFIERCAPEIEAILRVGLNDEKPPPC